MTDISELAKVSGNAVEVIDLLHQCSETLAVSVATLSDLLMIALCRYCRLSSLA